MITIAAAAEAPVAGIEACRRNSQHNRSSHVVVVASPRPSAHVIEAHRRCLKNTTMTSSRPLKHVVATSSKQLSCRRSIVAAVKARSCSIIKAVGRPSQHHHGRRRTPSQHQAGLASQHLRGRRSTQWSLKQSVAASPWLLKEPGHHRRVRHPASHCLRPHIDAHCSIIV